MREKDKLEFIIGFSHSGSSILARILNTTQNSVNVGEVMHFANCFSRDVNCSCGETIKNCGFWQEIDIQKGSLLCIRYKDIFHPTFLKKKVIYNRYIYNKIFDQCRLEHKTNVPFSLIDNSKHPFRTLVLAVCLRKNYNVKVYFTKRPLKKILESFKKRNSKKRKSWIHRNLVFFYPFLFLFRMITATVKLLLRMFKVDYEVVGQKTLFNFVEKNKERFNIQHISGTQYKIIDFFNHSFGGSSSSEESLLKLGEETLVGQSNKIKK